MEIVQRFKSAIAWYQPTTDTDSWKYFYNQVYNINYDTANAETLKRVAWYAAKLRTSVDVGMWETRKSQLLKFLRSDIALSGDDAVCNEAIQYEFVACFLNDYAQASHNNDLWQSINNAARNVLQEAIVDGAAVAAARGKVAMQGDLPSGAKWLLPAIPLIIYSAIKSIDLAYYKPTEDTNTWAYFQNVMFDINLLDKVHFTFNQTYLLSDIASSADSGMWSTFQAAMSAFLDANLGYLPATAQAQTQLAIDFCGRFKFDYQHAAHNKDLFKAYNDSFANATTKLRAILN